MQTAESSIKQKVIKTIHMGINTRPYFNYEKVLKGYESEGAFLDAKNWKISKLKSNSLKEEIIKEVELNNICMLYWKCGVALFKICANEWAKALSQYKFTVDSYYCKVEKIL